ncbi:HNH endonuclease signature motif containing protein [Brevibacterium luteolum]|uniref:HNH nuclease domain-containing protein n=1 Tax=Brevibacterium luteolum TaxID=199591 RepID=A0A2N6PEQ4_9MICO|nr:HNH endonuclease signature motif containing protein [Brevibacterium luteolum]PMB97160.1 hypothetical protein CJ198_12690 [Brevibacterium luteolum]
MTATVEAPVAVAAGAYRTRFCAFEQSLSALERVQLQGYEEMFGVVLERVRADSRDNIDTQVDALHSLASADPTDATAEPQTAGEASDAARAEALTWLRDRIGTPTLAALAHALDITSNTAWSRVTGAATAFIGLPKLTAQVRAGRLSFDRFVFAAGQAASVDPALLGQLDTLLASITATKKSVYFSEVKAAIAALVTRAEQAQQIRERRRVEAFYDQHGRGTLIVQGPSHEIALLHARLEGMARCVVRGYTAGFDLPDNHVFADSRSFEQLKYDFLIGATIGGDVNTLDLAQEALAKRQESSGHTSSPLDLLADDLADLLSDTPISCPASGQWLARQAKITITVPAMALTEGPAADELPGSVDGSPISADVARQLVGSAGDTVYRLLTDPNTGEVLDHVATTYTIGARMRHALVARWRYCTAPGCDRPATKTELDHIEPFNHRHPTRGGPTTMENLHPLCKQHHQLKTQGVFRLRREPRTGVLTWTLPGGTTATTHPPGSVLHRRHAELITNTTPAEPHQPGSPDPHNEPNDGLFSPAEACPS